MTSYIFAALYYLRAERNNETVFANQCIITPPPVGKIGRAGFGRVKQENLFEALPESEFQQELNLWLEKGVTKTLKWREYVLIQPRSRIILKHYPSNETRQCYPVQSFEYFPFGSFRLLRSPDNIHSLQEFVEWHESLFQARGT